MSELETREGIAEDDVELPQFDAQRFENPEFHKHWIKGIEDLMPPLTEEE